MDEEVQQPDSQEEVQAAADAQAGYERRTRAGSTEPAPVVAPAVQPEAAVSPLADSVPPSASTPDPEPAPDPQAEPAGPSVQVLAQTLEDVRAQLKELKDNGADAATVRRMHGEIGELNRTMKQLKALENKAQAPADDELAAALSSAEKVAEEYPDIAGPLFKALKALQSRAPQPAPAAAEPETPDLQQLEPTQATPERDAHGYTAEERAAIQALDEVHPDRFKVKATPEFQTWFAAKPPEYQTKVNTSWNPAVLSKCFDDFKATLAARKSKQNRVEAAVQPSGTPQRSQPTVLPDEAGTERGYKRRAAQRL